MTSNSKAEGRFGTQDFRYVAEEDVYICPAGERLAYHHGLPPSGAACAGYNLTRVMDIIGVQPLMAAMRA